MSTPETLPPDLSPLVDAALAAMDRAICPYSRFSVGAALQDGEGRIWTGSNVENASYNLGLCAERVAMFHALTHGARDFRHVVVATDTETPTPPCGSCRQILWEFAPAATLTLVTKGGRVHTVPVADLLPLAFDARNLDEGSS